jgi:benzoate membrane transport protein
LSLVLIWRYRQPLVVTGNVFILIFVLLLGAELGWTELVGATMLAGAIVLVLGLTGLTDRLASLLPAPIVFGLLAGTVLPFVAGMFTELGQATLIVGSTLAAYFLARAALGRRIPAILPALLVGAVVAGADGAMGPIPTLAWPVPSMTLPELTLRAVLSATPVMVVLITLQANAPSVVFLRNQDYEPPERMVAVMSGIGTTLGSIFGPMGVSLSLPATALVAGPDAGERGIRHWAAYVAAGIGVIIALLSGFAAEFRAVIPPALLAAAVGLAVIGILSEAIQQIGRGPLLLGPMLAFTVSLSELQLFGLGRFFWALAIGIAGSLLLEREQWRSLRVNAT